MRVYTFLATLFVLAATVFAADVPAANTNTRVNSFMERMAARRAAREAAVRDSAANASDDKIARHEADIIFTDNADPLEAGNATPATPAAPTDSNNNNNNNAATTPSTSISTNNQALPYGSEFDFSNNNAAAAPAAADNNDHHHDHAEQPAAYHVQPVTETRTRAPVVADPSNPSMTVVNGHYVDLSPQGIAARNAVRARN